MSSSPKTVFVLGAGFTKAFLPKAPLLEADYDGEQLLEECEHLPYAHRILDLELTTTNGASKPRNRLNLERLMTRLQGGMPYDYDVASAQSEMGVLLTKLKEKFRQKMSAALPIESDNKKVLDKLAQHCLANGINCITFNYDELFDEALWNYRNNEILSAPRWGPSGGYGFFCRTSELCIRDISTIKWVTNMLLLKLHGSLNWRVKKGQPKPYGFDAIMHHEKWWKMSGISGTFGGNEVHFEEVSQYLEPEPFMVPPVLAKADLVEQPALRLLWSKAYELLSNSEKVTFVGYSIPVTDIAAGTLFRESLSHLNPLDIKVIDFARPDGESRTAKMKTVLAAYEKVFPGITESQVDLSGGLEWAKSLVQ